MNAFELSFGFVGIILVAAGTAVGQPLITTQPQDQTNYVGTTAALTVVATGTGPLSYQWQKCSVGFVDLAAGTNAVLTLPNVQTNDADDYRCVVTDATGTTNSATAHLYVNPPETLFISNSAPGMITLSWKRTMVLVEAITTRSLIPNSGYSDCAIWFCVSDTSPVTLPVHSEPRFFRLVALPVGNYQDSLGACRNFDVASCEACIRTYFLGPGPWADPSDLEEAADVGIGLGSCLCAQAQVWLGAIGVGFQPQF